MLELTVKLQEINLNPDLDLDSKKIIGSARTCYSKRLIGIDEAFVKRDGKPWKTDSKSLLIDLYKSGHTTPFEHVVYTFSFENISRALIQFFLHNHLFYNSEQQSQRYASMDNNGFYVPNDLDDKTKQDYINYVNSCFKFYDELRDSLKPVVEKYYFDRFNRTNELAIEKKSQEVARYVLPISTFANMYHTINLLTFFRYYITSKNNEFIRESQNLINQMKDIILSKNPSFKEIFDLLDKEKEKYEIVNYNKDNPVLENLIDQLNDKKVIMLDEFRNINYDKIIADKVRLITGLNLNDREAIQLIFDPNKNPISSNILNLTTYDYLTKVLNNIYVGFFKAISLSEDAQNQRHRTMPLTKLPLDVILSKEKLSYEIPWLIKNSDSKVLNKYVDFIENSTKKIYDIYKKNPELAKYMLLNSHKIFEIETGSLAGFKHKVEKRTCLNAQREIWDTIMQTKELFNNSPILQHYLFNPPCFFVNKCTEGSRYCGVPVFKDPEKYLKERTY